jgi:DNA polymerase-3 subunit beta
MNTEYLDSVEDHLIEKLAQQLQFELRVSKQILLKAISHVQSIVEKRNIIPILSNIKITANNGILELSATDMEIEIKEQIAAEIVENGSITVEAATLFDIVKKLPDEEFISIKLDNNTNKLMILCAKCKFSISYLESAKFPSIDYGDLPYSITFTATDLIKIIDRIKASISTDETRYNINGIFLHEVSKNDTKFLTAVATDGHRLSLIEMNLPNNTNTIQDIILPRKTIMELRKLLDNVTGDVVLEFSGNKARFNFENIKLISKLLDGTFPEYQELIPKNNQMIMKINKKQFSSAIDRVSIIAFDKLKSVKLTLKHNLLVVSSVGDASESATEEVSIDYDHQEIEIGFNARYLLEIILSISGDEVECFFDNDVDSAVLIRDASDASATHVIMPMLV